MSAHYVVVEFDTSDATVTESDVWHDDLPSAEAERDELQAVATARGWSMVYAVREAAA